MASSTADTTTLLHEARSGDRGASDLLFGRLYDELRVLARARLRAQPPGVTLDTTGLVHEAYLRLIDRARVTPADRAHLFALAARAMRYVLLDRARARMRHKRGGPGGPIPFDAVQVAADERAAELLAMDEALERLRGQSERLAQVVEYRFFGGLTYEEVAEATGRSVASVERDWMRARTWLYRAMQEGGAGAVRPLGEAGRTPGPAMGA